MATFTPVDLAAASKFAQANFHIRLIQTLHDKAPWVASWLEYSIRDATEDDFYIPDKLKSVAKVVDVHIPEKLCNDVLSCNPNKQETMCKPEDEASYYWLGDQQLGIQCQPSCFHIAPKKKTPDEPVTINNSRVGDDPAPDDDGNKDDPDNTAQMYMLNYNRAAKKCRIVNSPVVSVLERPYFRSPSAYVRRLNDMPTGFSRVDISDVDPVNSGISYRFNPAYCGYYDLTFTTLEDTQKPDGSDVSCEYQWWEKGLSAILGMSLINGIKSQVRVLFTDSVFKVPANLIKKPDKVPIEFTLDGWKNNINTEFKIPELIDTEIITLTNPNIPAPKRPVRSIHDIAEKARQFADFFRRMAAGLVESLKHKDIYIALGIDIAFNKALKKIEAMSLKFAEKLLSHLESALPELIAKQIGDRIITTAMRSVLTTASLELAIRLGAQFAVAMAKILAASASVIGWILIAGFVFDLLFQVFDPWGYTNMMGNVQPAHIMLRGEQTLRQLFEGAENTTFTFNMLVGRILEPEVLMSVQLSTLYDTILYLDSLTVNSDGLRIEKGYALDAPENIQANVHIGTAEGLTYQYAFDEKSYEEYNSKFMARVNLVGKLNIVGVVMLSVGSILYIVNTAILGILCIIIGLVLLAISCLSLYQNTFVNLASNANSDEKFSW